MSAPIVAVRRVLHPGKPRAGRVAASVGYPYRALVWLDEGQSLHTALVQAYALVGAASGAFDLLGGTLATAAYHVTGPQTDSLRVAEYNPATIMAGPVTLIQATGSFGPSLQGAPMVHIHGAFADAAGHARGSHVNPDLSIVGSGGVRALLMWGAGYRQIDDAETLYPLFFPTAEPR